MKFMVDEMEADKVRRLLEAADVNYIPMEDPSITPKNCRDAATKLSIAFSWKNTKEGKEYWENVHDKLIEYAQMGEK